MNCNICNNTSKLLLTKKVLGTYDAEYFQCEKCGFIQVKDPHWLKEAYQDAINTTDTGLISRNIYFSEMASLLMYFYLDKSGIGIDFAGGYGVFTRLMRDKGFDFYWSDPLCKNLFALGFEFDTANTAPVTLLTSFESFEHFADPHKEIGRVLEISNTIMFSTVLVPENQSPEENWWYYSFNSGQHISFYSRRSLEEIAKKYGLRLYTDGVSLHLLTAKKIPFFNFTLLKLLRKIELNKYVGLRMSSKTLSDSNLLYGKD